MNLHLPIRSVFMEQVLLISKPADSLAEKTAPTYTDVFSRRNDVLGRENRKVVALPQPCQMEPDLWNFPEEISGPFF